MRFFIFVATAIVATLLQASLVSALPFPLSTVNIPLILIIYSITRLALRRASMYACVVGVCLDALSPHPFGMTLVAFLSVSIIFVFVCTRIVTHLSLLATTTLYAASFVVYQLVITLFALIITTFSANTFLTVSLRQRLIWILWGVLIHTVIAIMSTYGSNRLQRFFHALFLTPT